MASNWQAAADRRAADDYAAHFGRMWAGRHDVHVHVFADGSVYDRAARRQGIRQNVAAQRHFRARAAGAVA